MWNRISSLISGLLMLVITIVYYIPRAVESFTGEAGDLVSSMIVFTLLFLIIFISGILFILRAFNFRQNRLSDRAAYLSILGIIIIGLTYLLFSIIGSEGAFIAVVPIVLGMMAVALGIIMNLVSIFNKKKDN